MRTAKIISLFFVLVSCQSHTPRTAIDVTITSFDSFGEVTFMIRNASDKAICSSNAGIGIMPGESAIRLRNGTARAFPIVYDWFDEGGPKVERVEFESNSENVFSTNIYDAFSVEQAGTFDASIKIPLWDCATDIPLYTTLEHEETWGPGYLSNLGVFYIEGDQISVTLSPQFNRH